MKPLSLLLALALALAAHAAPPTGVFADAHHTLLLRVEGASVQGYLFVEGRAHTFAGKEADGAVSGTLDGRKPVTVTPTADGVQLAVEGESPRPLARTPLPSLAGTWAGGDVVLRVSRTGDRYAVAGATGVRLSGYRLEGTRGEAPFALAWRPDGVRYLSGDTDVEVGEMRVSGFRFLRLQTFEAPNDTEGKKSYRVAIYRNERYARALGLADDKTTVEAEFVRLPPDGAPIKTTVGSPDTEKGRETDEGVREITITPFLIARTETTQQLWKALKGKPVKQPFPGPRKPATQMTWYDAADFCKRAGLVLPTDYEFEYANRGGTRTPFWTGARITLKQANINLLDRYHPDDVVQKGKGTTVDVGSYPPNAYGLHDTTGNCWEWCADLYPNPQAFRVRRGGGITTQPRGARSSNRSAAAPFHGGNTLGFRAVYRLPKK